MAANSNIQIADLDFDVIKLNLKTFLKSQPVFQDYNFEGSGLSTLLNVLAYNTHYNSYYLNMVANEMFMDTAVLRNSVVSHAKLLNYVPKSSIAPRAEVNVVVNNVMESSFTLPKFTKFQSEAIDGYSYSFVTKDTYTVSTLANTALFTGIEIYQGEPVQLASTLDITINPQQKFILPSANADTTTLIVQVQESFSNTVVETYNYASDVSTINGSSKVYFLQEGLDGFYELYFGDNILGKSLSDGNIIYISYIDTQGTAATSANSFVVLNDIGDAIVYGVTPASGGSEKESIDSIKFQAPKAYSSGGRAVSYNDYISIIQQNKLGFAIDSVSVWGGEDNVPPAYGQVFISIKPANALALTDSQKNRLMREVIEPVSVVTVKPTLVDPDFTFIKVVVDVFYDQNQTSLTSAQLQNLIKQQILKFSDNNLNTFNSTFSLSDLSISIQETNSSIMAINPTIKVQKKIYPTLNVFKRYVMNFGVPLERSVFQAGITSSPSLQYFTTGSNINLISDLYLEEVPFATSGIESIGILNPGFNYTATPEVIITGDGTGAMAHAVVKNGYIDKIVVDDPGSNYTQAIVTIKNASGDTSGLNGSAYAILQGQYGKLRTYYFNSNGVKTILHQEIGTIDYYNGVVTLDNFAPNNVNDPLGQLTITATPNSSIVSSSRNRIITIDPFDPNAIIVNMIAK